jgi:Zn-dependent M16 (insulinase) family peptidase
LKESTIDTVEFPEKDESMGEISIGFLGPNCNDAKAMAALETLGTFLAGSSVSILENQLVEIKEPLASSVQFYVEERPNSLIWLQLTSVPTKKLAEVEKRLFEVLKKTVSEPIDLAYVQECLRRTKRQRKFSVESSGYYFSNPLITDFIFGERDGSTLKSFETLSAFDELEKWTETDWRDFLRKWVADNEHVSILGKPSAKLAKKIEEDEKKRVAAQKAKFGEEGLKKLQEKLEKAKADNDREIPKEELGKFPVPGVESIHFIKTETARAGLAVKDGKG